MECVERCHSLVVVDGVQNHLHLLLVLAGNEFEEVCLEPNLVELVPFPAGEKFEAE